MLVSALDKDGKTGNGKIVNKICHFDNWNSSTPEWSKNWPWIDSFTLLQWKRIFIVTILFMASSRNQ